jgi:hypothetical protein
LASGGTSWFVTVSPQATGSTGMGRFFSRIVAPAVLIAAAILLALTGPGHYTLLRIACTIIVGLPGALSLGNSLAERLGLRREPAARTVYGILRSRVVMLSRDRRFHDVDASRISLHVWEVRPWLLRTIFPFYIRRRLPDLFSEATVRAWSRRLTFLKCLTRYRVDPQPDSGVRFRKGKGLVGICVEENRKGKALFVDFEARAFKSAIANEESWANAPAKITRSLSYKDALKLADRYGQAVALVIQDESGEAIGALTMSLPPKCSVRIGDAALKDLIEALGETAEVVCSVLTGRKGRTRLA